MLCLIQQIGKFLHPQPSPLHHSNHFLINYVAYRNQGEKKLVINVLVSSERLVGRFPPTVTLSSPLAPPSANENSTALDEVVTGSLNPSKMMLEPFAVLLKLSSSSLDPCEATLEPFAALLTLSGASSNPFGASPWTLPPPGLSLHRKLAASAGMNWSDHEQQWWGQQYLEEPAWATTKDFGGSSNPREGRISSIFQGIFWSASTLPRPLSSA